MSVTNEERKLVRLMVSDQDRITRLGTASATRLVASGLNEGIRHFRAGCSPVPAVLGVLDELTGLITDAMVASHLEGLRRAVRQAPIRFSFKQSITFLKKRLALSETEINLLAQQYSQEALRIVPKLRGATEKVLQETLVDISEQGMHVKQGVKALREGYAVAGLVPKSKFTLETIFRTQTQLAYSAGRWDQEQAPEIQEILWGYTYTTVGDDRVRDEHIGFDGVTLPKEDAFWDANFPPNGWNCRCVAIAVYEEREVIQPIAVDGIVPVASEGFNFHPGKLFAAIK